jgi:hypothetical protein
VAIVNIVAPHAVPKQNKDIPMAILKISAVRYLDRTFYERTTLMKITMSSISSKE